MKPHREHRAYLDWKKSGLPISAMWLFAHNHRASVPMMEVLHHQMIFEAAQIELFTGNSETLRTTAAGAIIGKSSYSTRMLCREKRLPCIKRNGQFYIHKEYLEWYANEMLARSPLQRDNPIDWTAHMARDPRTLQSAAVVQRRASRPLTAGMLDADHSTPRHPPKLLQNL